MFDKANRRVDDVHPVDVKSGTDPNLADRPIAAFRDEEDGSLVVFSLFAFIIMFILGGIAVDVINTEHKRVHLQNTLDHAVLASASLQQNGEPRLVVEDYFKTAGLVEYLDPMASTDYLALTDERRVQASAGTQVPTYFVKVLGIDSFSALAVSAAEEAQSQGASEVSLVMSISDDMSADGRAEDIKDAAKELVTILLTGEAAATTSINVVPFAGHVNPGPEMFDHLGGVEYGTTGEDIFPESKKDISNVVFYYDSNGSDAQPYDYYLKIEGYPGGDVDLFNKDDLDEYVYFADAYLRREAGLPDDDVLAGVSWKAGPQTHGPYRLNGETAGFAGQNTGKGAIWEGDFGPFYSEVIAQHSSCLDLVADDFDHSGLPSEGSYDQVAHFSAQPVAGSDMDWGWCPEDDTAILYAQNSLPDLHAYLDKLRLHDGTGTHIGMKYGLALLDPGSQDEFDMLADRGLVPNAFRTRPSAWEDTGVKKYVVLMSAGGIDDQVRPNYPLDPVNEVSALADQSTAHRLTQSMASDNLASFYALCEAAKAKDVEIFAIAFSATSEAREQLANCASSSAHFIEAEGSDLSSMFGNVGGNITQLRLTR